VETKLATAKRLLADKKREDKKRKREEKKQEKDDKRDERAAEEKEAEEEQARAEMEADDERKEEVRELKKRKREEAEEERKRLKRAKEGGPGAGAAFSGASSTVEDASVAISTSYHRIANSFKSQAQIDAEELGSMDHQIQLAMRKKRLADINKT
jgi:hypothetical protein